jgi:hypothetical protein
MLSCWNRIRLTREVHSVAQDVDMVKEELQELDKVDKEVHETDLGKVDQAVRSVV